MKKFNWLFLFLFAFAFVACDDDDDEVTLDTTDPVITITSPTAGSTIVDNTINVEGTVTDNMGLDEVMISITDPSGTTRELSDETITDFLNDDKEADIDLDITLEATSGTGTYVIMVTAMDDAGNEATQSVSVMKM